ncbi:V-type ATP synthase subunit F [Methanocorpusculum labreanum]|uniref:A-type ATP synthase subunit F n=1 Tax=Methanocorpusculum labreanum (strain ATCC 43576 / DSM 4855 / Z) TaxID=410358 RepID=AATF_METLZ|nr:V-type ATP synthase subunit F [Methanocorpusculum labreanum]A2SST4.1 RecName: Full=V-type ATP synthase subunit F; Short=V-type ATPase subunit F [Methanocorpusculum labreanum Z]ABN07390.1 Vacuolar H+-transporting two-sector ATPase, F subunit [Methanocorpusculum labreanum Z]
MEIAVIGNKEFVLGFQLAGIKKTYSAENPEKLAETITKVLDDTNVGILVLQSTDLEQIPRRLQVIIENSVKPTIVTIGGQEAGLSLRERIKRSVGVDLWK